MSLALLMCPPTLSSMPPSAVNGLSRYILSSFGVVEVFDFLRFFCQSNMENVTNAEGIVSMTECNPSELHFGIADKQATLAISFEIFYLESLEH